MLRHVTGNVDMNAGRNAVTLWCRVLARRTAAQMLTVARYTPRYITALRLLFEYAELLNSA